MKLRYEPLNFEHFKFIDVNEQQQQEKAAMLSSYGQVAARHTGLEAWAGSICLGAAGLLPVYPGKFLMAWALLSRHTGPYMLGITRQVRRMLDWEAAERIEMTVRADFPQAVRWAEQLGFVCETPTALKKRSADGGDEYIFARVKQ